MEIEDPSRRVVVFKKEKTLTCRGPADGDSRHPLPEDWARREEKN
jgi:hypothetical protein